MPPNQFGAHNLRHRMLLCCDITNGLACFNQPSWGLTVYLQDAQRTKVRVAHLRATRALGWELQFAILCKIKIRKGTETIKGRRKGDRNQEAARHIFLLSVIPVPPSQATEYCCRLFCGKRDVSRMISH